MCLDYIILVILIYLIILLLNILLYYITPDSIAWIHTAKIIVLFFPPYQNRMCSCSLSLRLNLQEEGKIKINKYNSLPFSSSSECGRVSTTTWRNHRLLASHLPTSCLLWGRNPSSWRRSWPITRRYRQEEPPTTTRAPDKAYNTQRHPLFRHHHHPNSPSISPNNPTISHSFLNQFNSIKKYIYLSQFVI